jgi:hypothetical protein
MSPERSARGRYVRALLLVRLRHASLHHCRRPVTGWVQPRHSRGRYTTARSSSSGASSASMRRAASLPMRNAVTAVEQFCAVFFAGAAVEPEAGPNLLQVFGAELSDEEVNQRTLDTLPLLNLPGLRIEAARLTAASAASARQVLREIDAIVAGYIRLGALLNMSERLPGAFAWWPRLSGMARIVALPAVVVVLQTMPDLPELLREQRKLVDARLLLLDWLPPHTHHFFGTPDINRFDAADTKQQEEFTELINIFDCEHPGYLALILATD